MRNKPDEHLPAHPSHNVGGNAFALDCPTHPSSTRTNPGRNREFRHQGCSFLLSLLRLVVLDCLMTTTPRPRGCPLCPQSRRFSRSIRTPAARSASLLLGLAGWPRTSDTGWSTAVVRPKEGTWDPSSPFSAPVSGRGLKLTLRFPSVRNVMTALTGKPRNCAASNRSCRGSEMKIG